MNLLPPDTPHLLRYCSKPCGDAQWRADNRDRVNKATKAWCAANPERRRAITTKYYDAHAEEIARARREARASGRYTETYRAWRATERGQRAVQNSTLRTRYGITVEEYETMLAAQDGHCALCPRTPSDEGRRLAVDHDHACCPGRKSCGKCLRGLLCTSCNNRLPMVETPDVIWIGRARAYLTISATT